MIDKYKYDESCYGGDTEESCPEDKERFEAIAHAHSVPPEQMLAMLPVSLRKAAGRFYHHHIRGMLLRKMKNALGLERSSTTTPKNDAPKTNSSGFS